MEGLKRLLNAHVSPYLTALPVVVLLGAVAFLLLDGGSQSRARSTTPEPPAHDYLAPAESAFSLKLPTTAEEVCTAINDADYEVTQSEDFREQAESALEEARDARRDYVLGDDFALDDARESLEEVEDLTDEGEEADRQADRLLDRAESRSKRLSLSLKRLVRLLRTHPQSLVAASDSPYGTDVPLRKIVGETADALAEDDCNVVEARRLERELRYHSIR